MQNNKRYWLRIGITLAGLHLLIGVLMLVIFLFRSNPSAEDIMFFLFLAIPDYPAVWIMQYLDLPGRGLVDVFYIILFGTSQWFLFGSILGLVYGKIKNRKSLSKV